MPEKIAVRHSVRRAVRIGVVGIGRHVNAGGPADRDKYARLTDRNR